MRAVFLELPPFARHREHYLADEALRLLQAILMRAPEVGVLIEGSGGLRKLRLGDARRGKGKRGGLRVIYFHWAAQDQFWLFTLYDKDEMEDLTAAERAVLKRLLKDELSARQCK
jgi:hypothetical protein